MEATSELVELRLIGLQRNAEVTARDAVNHMINTIARAEVNLSTNTGYGTFYFENLEDRQMWLGTLKAELTNEFDRHMKGNM